MKCNIPMFALAALFASQATAHTTLQYFWPDSTEADSTTSCVRKPPNNNPVQDVTSDDMACNVDGTTAASSTCSVTAGSTVSVEWHHTDRADESTDSDDPIASSHKGPIMTYMAKVDDASTTDVTSLDWFKIQEDGYSNGEWAVDKLYAAKTGVWPATIPTDIEDGDYLLRGEIIALHSASSYPGAQFYIGCVQLSITGGSGGTPDPTVKFPGAYASTDPGITINIYSGLTSYTIPGPAVYGSSSNSSSSDTSSAVASSAAAVVEATSVAESSSAAATSAVATSAAATSAAATTAAAETSAAETSAAETSAAETSAVETSAAATSAVETSSAAAAVPTTFATSTKAATTAAATTAAAAATTAASSSGSSSEAINQCLDEVNSCIAKAQGDDSAMSACADKRTSCYSS